MGIQRLTTVVQRLVWQKHAIHDAETASVRLPEKSVALLDGNGFVGWVCSHVDTWSSEGSLEWELRGGDYAAVDGLVRAWVSTFLAHGVTTLAVFDSDASIVESTAKVSTGDQRRADRQDSVAMCLTYCAGGAVDESRLKVQYPRMLGRQVRSSLAAAGAMLLDTPGEADGLMLRLSAAGSVALPAPTGHDTEPPIPVACLIGMDSDFMISDRCRYVPLNWLSPEPVPAPPAAGGEDAPAHWWLRLVPAAPAEDTSDTPGAPAARPAVILEASDISPRPAGLPALRLPVISPADVATALGIPSRRLLDLAVLAGNDFTGPHLAPYPPPRLQAGPARGTAHWDSLQAESALLLLLAELGVRSDEGGGGGSGAVEGRAEGPPLEEGEVARRDEDGPDPLGVFPLLRVLHQQISSSPPPRGFPACAQLYAPLDTSELLDALRVDVRHRLGMKTAREVLAAARRAARSGATAAARAAAAGAAPSSLPSDLRAAEDDDPRDPEFDEAQGDASDADVLIEGAPALPASPTKAATSAVKPARAGAGRAAPAAYVPDTIGPVEVAVWIRSALCCCPQPEGGSAAVTAAEGSSGSGVDAALAASLTRLTLGDAAAYAAVDCGLCAKPHRLCDVVAMRRLLRLRPRLSLALQHTQSVAEGLEGSSFVDCVALLAAGSRLAAPTATHPLTSALASSQLLNLGAPELLPAALLYCAAPHFSPAQEVFDAAERRALVTLQTRRVASNSAPSLAEALLPAAMPLLSSCFPTPPGAAPKFDLEATILGRVAPVEDCLEDIDPAGGAASPRRALLLLPLASLPLGAVPGPAGSCPHYDVRLRAFLRWATVASHSWTDAWAEWSGESAASPQLQPSLRPSHWLLPLRAANHDAFADEALSLLVSAPGAPPHGTELLASLAIRHLVAAASHKTRLARAQPASAALAAAAAAMPSLRELSAVAVTAAFCCAAPAAAGLGDADAVSRMQLLGAFTHGTDSAVVYWAHNHEGNAQAADVRQPAAAAFVLGSRGGACTPRLPLRDVSLNTWAEGVLATLLGGAEDAAALRRRGDATGAADGPCPLSLLLPPLLARCSEDSARAAAAAEPLAVCHPLLATDGGAAAAAAMIVEPAPSHLWHGPLFTAVLALQRQAASGGSLSPPLAPADLARLTDSLVDLVLSDSQGAEVAQMRAAVRASSARVWSAALAAFDLAAVCADLLAPAPAQAPVALPSEASHGSAWSDSAVAAGSAVKPVRSAGPVPSQAASKAGAAVSTPVGKTRTVAPPPAAAAPPPVAMNALPIMEHRHTILGAIAAHTVCVIKGDTGSGKSSQSPQYILDASDVVQGLLRRPGGEAFLHGLSDDAPASLPGMGSLRGVELGAGLLRAWGDRPAHLLITQPRRIAAVTLATRVCDERSGGRGDVKAGGEIGYRIGQDRECEGGGRRRRWVGGRE